MHPIPSRSPPSKLQPHEAPIPLSAFPVDFIFISSNKVDLPAPSTISSHPMPSLIPHLGYNLLETPPLVLADNTIDALVIRAQAEIKMARDHGITAGCVLLELKTRITDKTSDEGREWGWAWRFFVSAKLQRNYSHVQRLIRYSQDPDSAVAHKQQMRQLNRKRREKKENVVYVDHQPPAAPPAEENVVPLNPTRRWRADLQTTY
jgi:hypothetical protein